MHIFLSVKFPWFLLPNHLTTKDLSDYFFLMKKFLLSLVILLRTFFLFSVTSAQFTSTTCDGQSHCAAPTPGINYRNTIVYIGEQGDEFDLWFQANFDKQRTLLQEIFVADSKSFPEEELLAKINMNLKEIQSTNILIINTSNFDILFQLLGKINSTTPLNLQDKTIYLVTNSNKYFIKRILAKQIKSIEIEKLYTVPKDKLLNFLSSLSLDKIDNEEEKYITPFSLSFQETSKFLIISYIIDHLIYNGFPIDLIGLFLLLTLGALVVSILRQVVGFSVFGIYTPLLFAISLYTIGIPLSCILLTIGLIAKLLVRAFTKKIYLLHNAKTSLLVMIYFFLLLVIFGLNMIFSRNLFDVIIFSKSLIILPIIFMIIISDKVFNDNFKFTKIHQRIALLEFAIVSFAVYWLFYRTGLKHLLLAFPELLLLIFLLNIAVGRFTGLQLLEYFRFMPLIKNSSEAEEEEE